MIRQTSRGRAWRLHSPPNSPSLYRATTLRSPWPRALRATLRKGSRGRRYIEVLCDDEAVVGPRSNLYVPGKTKHLKVSPRCVLDEDSARGRIKLSQDVRFTLVAAGRGFKLLGDFKRGPLGLRILQGAVTRDGGRLAKEFF